MSRDNRWDYDYERMLDLAARIAGNGDQIDLSDRTAEGNKKAVALAGQIVADGIELRELLHTARRSLRRLVAEQEDQVSESAARTSRGRVSDRLPGFRKIITEYRDSGDPDKIADAAFILGMFDDIAEVGAEMNDRLHDAATVIERMANGASRAECSPELDRVIAALREIDGDEENEVDELQKRADEIYAADRAEDYNHMRDDDADA